MKKKKGKKSKSAAADWTSISALYQEDKEILGKEKKSPKGTSQSAVEGESGQKGHLRRKKEGGQPIS